MFCPNCSNDKFRVVDVWRERKYRPEKGFVFDPKTDTRRILCLKCKSIFITETQIVYTEKQRANEADEIL